MFRSLRRRVGQGGKGGGEEGRTKGEGGGGVERWMEGGKGKTGEGGRPNMEKEGRRDSEREEGD